MCIAFVWGILKFQVCSSIFSGRAGDHAFAGCDVDGSALVQRADDRGRPVRARLARQLGPLHDVPTTTRAGGILHRIDGAARSTTSPRPPTDLAAWMRTTPDGHAEVARRDRAHAPRRPDRRRGPRPRRGGAQARRLDRATSTRSPSATSARPAPSRRSRAIRA